MHFLSAAQVAAIAKTVPPAYGALIYVLAYGGLRWGEAAALRRSRCHLLRSRLEIVESVAEVCGKLHLGETKTYQRRTVVIPRFLGDLLAEHLAGQAGDGPDSFVFTGREGGLLRNSNFRERVWQPAVQALDLPSDLRIHASDTLVRPF